MFKLIGKLFNLCFLAIILALVFHNWTARVGIQFFLSRALGAPVSIREANVGFRDTQLLLKGIRIGNPAGFDGESLAEIPELFMDFEISSLGEGRLHFETLTIDIAKIQVIRAADGRLNILSFKTSRSTGSERESSGGSESPLRFHFDRMVLSIGNALYVDMSEANPRVKGFRVDLRGATYENVESLPQILKITSTEILKRLGLNKLGEILGRLF